MAVLSIELSESEVVLGEPVQVRFVFTEPVVRLEVPFEPTEGGLCRLELLDPSGKVLAWGDGVTREQRQGRSAVRGNPAWRETFALPAGEAWAWEEDLLACLDVPGPGTYQVRAEFRFPPASVHARSEPVALNVTPPDVRGLDAVVDEVALPVLHLVQTHAEPIRRTVVTFGAPDVPSVAAYGVGTGAAASDDARISITDFRTTASFAHDYQRVLAWLDAGQLVLARYSERAIAVWAREPLDAVSPRLVGRPVQHESGEVSVWVTDLEDRAHVVRYRFDATGARIEAVRQALGVTEPTGHALGSDAQGGVHLVFAQAGRLPLWHVRVSDARPNPARPLLEVRSHRDADGPSVGPYAELMDLRVDGKPPDPRRGVAVVAAWVESGRGTASRGPDAVTVQVVRSPLSAVGWRVWEWAVRPSLHEGEQVRIVRVSPAEPELVAALVVTSAGRLLHLAASGEIRVLPAAVRPEVAHGVRLVSSAAGVWLLHPDPAYGVVSTPLR